MRTFLTLTAVLLIALFYTSCSDSDSVLNSHGNEFAGTDISFSGSASGIIDEPAGTYDATRHLDITSGNCTLVGNCKGGMDYVVTNYTGTQLNGQGDFTYGTGELIDLSNGHKLYAINVHGHFTIVDGVTHSISYGDISGGTGRFNNASGTIEYEATMQIDRSVVVTWSGQLGHGKPFGGELIGTLYPQSWNCGGYTMGRTGDGDGTLQHLDNTTASLEFCVQYTPFNDGWVVNKGSSATNTLTAENGDKIYLETTGGTFKNTGQYVWYDGTPHVKVDGLYSFDIVGGTGRFANASGKIHSVGYSLMSGLDQESHAFSTWYGSWNY